MIANDLQVEIEKLKIDEGGHRQAIVRAVRSMRRSRMLKEKQAKLEKYTQMFNTHVLMRLDAHSLRHSHDLDSLDRGVRDLVSRIERGQSTTAQLLANQTCQIQDHFDQRFNNREREREIEQDYEEFKASLFFKDIESRHDQISEAFKGTCRWIFDPPITEGNNARKWSNFRDWLVAGEGAYWISGKPGSGKSTLMKYIVNEPWTAQYLSEWERDSELIVISFFFWKLGTELQKGATGLLRSLLFQIAKQWPNLMNLVLKAYGRSRGRSDAPARLDLLPTWTTQRLLAILEDFVNKKPTTVSLCAFIDGLDEFDGDEDLLLEIIRLFSSAPGCKVCVSSRPEQAFREEFRGCPQCRVQDLNEKDIRTMVVEKLKPRLAKNLPIEAKVVDNLGELLVRKAEGVFLWLYLMIKDLINGLRNGDSIDELTGRLWMTPNTIDGLYRRILQGLDPFYLNDALRLSRS